jgi:hypothetical protein
MKYEIKNNQLIFNVSKGKENYGQRNNEFKWAHPKNPKLTMEGGQMCNVTAMVMALDYAGYVFPKGTYSQPEDNLCKFIFNTQEVIDFYKEKMPAMYNAFARGDSDAYCPNLVHIVLAFGTNKWLGTSSAVTFKDRIPILDLLSEVILYNRPVVLSGTFPYKYASGKIGTIGHINCLVGVSYDLTYLQQHGLDMTKLDSFERVIQVPPTNVIIDDPYGNYSQNFIAGTGNDVVMPFGDFIRYYKALGDVSAKMGHIIKPGAAVV